MFAKLPISVDDLLRQRTVEGNRIEYKKGWNPDPIIRTLCAFASDFENLGGGYIIIGQDCDKDDLRIFPLVGLPQDQLDKIQQGLLHPAYVPVLSVEKVEGRKLIVVWAPIGQNRPYKALHSVTAKQKSWHYYVRRYTRTVEARDEVEQELLSFIAKIPFDDRFHQNAGVQINVRWVPDSAGRDQLDQISFEGPRGRMTREVFGCIKRNYLHETVIKHPDRAKSTCSWNLFFAAVEEAIVNAVYHGSYQERKKIWGLYWRKRACRNELFRGRPNY